MPLGTETRNRFAGLKVDDDEDDSISSKGSSSNQNQSNAASKKKNKKKNKEADEALRNMAFGSKPAGSRLQKRGGGSASHQQRSQNNKPVSTEDWAEWQRRDEEATNDMYEQDLQKAILESRLEAEQKEAHKQAVKEGRESAREGGASGKKKKKDKPQAMSLDQFNQLPSETLPGSDDENEDPIPAPVQARVPIACQDKQYFESVASDANRILQKERIQEQYQKAYAHESAMQSKYQDEIEKLQKKITELESKLEEQGKDLQKVKGRNARLCKILADGEMKEKTAILMQVEELTSDKEHLTEQLASLTAELEKERSKNHTLKQENDKLKGKHGK